MSHLMLIDGDRVHRINKSLGDKADNIMCYFDSMKWKLLDYLLYKHAFDESAKKDTEQKTMMLDELRHFKHAYAIFFKHFKEISECEEEKTIINSLHETLSK